MEHEEQNHNEQQHCFLDTGPRIYAIALKNPSLRPYAIERVNAGQMMISIERKVVRLPPDYCDMERVLRCVKRACPPFTVRPQQGDAFSVRKRVYFAVDGLTVECDNDDELRLACKLAALNHNRGRDQQEEIAAETEQMEAEARAHMEAPLEEADFLPEELLTEEEDVTVEEWGQRGYKWFKKDEVVNL